MSQPTRRPVAGNRCALAAALLAALAAASGARAACPASTQAHEEIRTAEAAVARQNWGAAARHYAAAASLCPAPTTALAEASSLVNAGCLREAAAVYERLLQRTDLTPQDREIATADRAQVAAALRRAPDNAARCRARERRRANEALEALEALATLPGPQQAPPPAPHTEPLTAPHAPPTAQRAQTPGPPSPPPPPSPPHDTAHLWLEWGSGAAAVALLAGATVAGVLSHSANRQVATEMERYRESYAAAGEINTPTAREHFDSATAHRDRAQGQALAAWGMGTVGVAAAATWAYLYTTPRSQAGQPEPQLEFLPLTASGLQARWRF